MNVDGSESSARRAPSTAPRSRVTLVLEPGGMTIDGVWWPRSDSLVEELPALDVAVADTLGAGIARFSYVLGSWSDRPRRVRADRHLIKLGWFSHGATPDNVDLSLDDYRRVVLKVIPPETPRAEAEAFLVGATILTSWSGSPSATAAPPAGSPPWGTDLGAVRPSAPQPEDTEVLTAGLGALDDVLGELSLIGDPRRRERAARRVEWRAVEWALAAGRVRWEAHAEALETAGQPPPSSSPPWR